MGLHTCSLITVHILCLHLFSLYQTPDSFCTFADLQCLTTTCRRMYQSGWFSIDVCVHESSRLEHTRKRKGEERKRKRGKERTINI